MYADDHVSTVLPPFWDDFSTHYARIWQFTHISHISPVSVPNVQLYITQIMLNNSTHSTLLLFYWCIIGIQIVQGSFVYCSFVGT